MRELLIPTSILASVLAMLACVACASQPPLRSPPAAPAAASAVAPPPVAVTPRALGVQTLEASDPITHAALPLAVIYPAGAGGAAVAATEQTAFGPYTIAAGRGRPVAAGHWPLIVISHGHGGSLWGHHDLAEALARAGYVVAMVEHVGDSWRDQSGFRTDRVLIGRAYQVSATVDRVLAEPALAAHVDATRIGVAGFSAGGYTSLLLIGAQPDFAQVPDYCKRYPADVEICGGPLRRELAPAQITPTVDRRIRAAFVMAPFAVVFGPGAFRDVTAPVFLAWASEDRLLLPAENAARVVRGLPALAGTRVVTGAGHYVFLAPCEPGLAAEAPAICRDPPGVDRARVHAGLAGDAVAFFAGALRPPGR